MISAILFSLNDNYTDDNIERLYLCLFYLLDSVDEIIYIDWGSPNGITLYDALKQKYFFPETNKIKVIKYSREQIDTIIPTGFHFIQQSIIRNIGIRHASHEYIVSTNVDIIFPENKYLQKIIEDDDKKTFYSLNRKDVPFNSVLKLFNENKAKLREDLSILVIPYIKSGFVKGWVLEVTSPGISLCGTTFSEIG